ncbi:MAG: triose-phosphate isomerase [Candidatus Marsarchaeota archaeon]
MKTRTPAVYLNFKAYASATGKKAVELAKVAEEVSKETGYEVVVLPQHADLRMVKESVSIPVFAQSADPFFEGSHTGHITFNTLLDVGVDGVMVNHSEHRVPLDYAQKVVEMAKKYGLEQLVCAATPDEVAAVAAFEPDYVAVEPPELIGGPISVATAKPEVITASVDALKRVTKKSKLLCGAGIANRRDVQVSVKLGTVGVLLASAYTKASNPKAVLNDLVAGLAGAP